MNNRDSKTPSTSPRGLRVTTGLQAGATGVVKWFNDAKGFGFITPDEGGDDLFAHFSEVTGSSSRRLIAGQRVEFELKRGPKGVQAANIRGF
mgnify:CR=1 FL=1